MFSSIFDEIVIFYRRNKFENVSSNFESIDNWSSMHWAHIIPTYERKKRRCDDQAISFNALYISQLNDVQYLWNIFFLLSFVHKRLLTFLINFSRQCFNSLSLFSTLNSRFFNYGKCEQNSNWRNAFEALIEWVVAGCNHPSDKE